MLLAEAQVIVKGVVDQSIPVVVRQSLPNGVTQLGLSQFDLAVGSSYGLPILGRDTS
eukprot:CAMPEP_0115148662 /NCGR_PEP_ID=MMETSP0227-20121206/64006_1 /TAXON_ID=89957 /ORGANISM="Polarella glacialis, Strain CCMP 1383" /LENGTH=56 /DNA_ID=CAMNT_0002558737 /DNA_START=108 /DNA_END=274 /DNA_ORIENTATION=+